MTEQALQALCDGWRPIVGLLDWDVTIKLLDGGDWVDKFGKLFQGRAHFNCHEMAAVIYILEVRNDMDLVVPQDQEKTVVHELVHLKWAWLEALTPGQDEAPLFDLLLEQSVCAMANALVELKRAVELAATSGQEA